MHFLYEITIEVYFRLIMKFYNMLTNTRMNYLNAPAFVLSEMKKFRLNRWFHLLPTFVSSIVFTTKILPLLSDTLNQELAINSSRIGLYAVGSFLLISVLNGWLIEIYLERTSTTYRVAKAS